VPAIGTIGKRNEAVTGGRAVGGHASVHSARGKSGSKAGLRQ
jgi:hypothetical protein